MSCAFSSERVHAWLDGEHSFEAAFAAEQHVQGCAACAAEYRSARALSEALRGGGLVAAPPESLEARVRAGLERERRAPGRGVPGWAAVAAALVLGVALGALLIPIRGTAKARGGDDALVSAHVRSLSAGPLVEVPSGDRHAVKPWFAGRVDFSPKVVDLAAEGFPLKGGRVDRVAGQPTAVLAYGKDRHEVDLFVWIAPASSPAVTLSTVRGYHVARWTEGDLAYAAVSDIEEAELLGFANLIRR